MKKTDKFKKMSVLIIEDNIGDFVLVENYLHEKFEDLGVTNCFNYYEAVNYLKNAPDNLAVIFLDLNLPDANGIELVKEILKHSKGIPVIILSGYSDSSIAKKSLDLGAYNFLIKDEVNPEILEEVILSTIEK